MKTHIAFLSFAEPDKELAECLSKLFWLMGKKVYFAPGALHRSGSTAWKNAIRSAIQDSQSFLPVYTRHSIRRPWVLYESGVADAVGLERFPARVSSISVSEIEDLPSDSALCYDISIKDQLAHLITNICALGNKNRDSIAAEVQEKVMNSDFVTRILTLSKTRWVFIAGNCPNDLSQSHPGIEKWYTTQTEYNSRLRDFAEKLTECLFDKEFSIATCPQVPTFGMHVTEQALSLIASGEYGEHVDFRIAGIHPIDRDARELKLSSKAAKRKWFEHILSFRKTYLTDQEWLITIGGNEGTQEEYEAARACNVKVFAIPCFGGTAYQIFNKTKAGPCLNCTKKDGSCGKDEIAKIADYLKKGTA
ncbi:MAG: toll/interleukin-1 receptor domain-containing protein [Sedimentisphaerales bacterium]